MVWPGFISSTSTPGTSFCNSLGRPTRTAHTIPRMKLRLIEEAVHFAETSPEPSVDTLMEHVF